MKHIFVGWTVALIFVAENIYFFIRHHECITIFCIHPFCHFLLVTLSSLWTLKKYSNRTMSKYGTPDSGGQDRPGPGNGVLYKSKSNFEYPKYLFETLWYFIGISWFCWDFNIFSKIIRTPRMWSDCKRLEFCVILFLLLLRKRVI